MNVILGAVVVIGAVNFAAGTGKGVNNIFSFMVGSRKQITNQSKVFLDW